MSHVSGGTSHFEASDGSHTPTARRQKLDNQDDSFSPPLGTPRQQSISKIETSHLDTVAARISVGAIYTVDDLADKEILDRALRLLYRARFGQSKDYSRISPRIKYDKLHQNVVSSIEKKLKLHISKNTDMRTNSNFQLMSREYLEDNLALYFQHAENHKMLFQRAHTGAPFTTLGSKI